LLKKLNTVSRLAKTQSQKPSLLEKMFSKLIKKLLQISLLPEVDKLILTTIDGSRQILKEAAMVYPTFYGSCNANGLMWVLKATHPG